MQAKFFSLFSLVYLFCESFLQSVFYPLSMPRIPGVLVLVLVLLSAVLICASAERVVVYYSPGNYSKVSALANVDNSRVILRCKKLHFFVVNITNREFMRLKELGIKCERDKLVKAMYIPNDPLLPQQWGVRDISLLKAWNYTTGSHKVVVAVLDTGIDYNHPDLKANIWVNTKEIPNNGIDDDGNGYVDDYYGYNFYNNSSKVLDDDGHGTHCAGIIAGVINNSLGVAGVANVKIMDLKVLNASGYGYDSEIARAIVYATDNGANIISMSLGGPSYTAALEEACQYAWNHGVLLVAAAGNSGSNEVDYPAAFNTVIAVGAVNSNNSLAWFSNYGPNLELVAPGVNILSTFPRYPVYLSITENCTLNYTELSGTSMATPFVAGVAALLKSYNYSLTNAEIRRILDETARDLGSLGRDEYFGYGLVNATAAIMAVAKNTSTHPNPNYTVTGSINFTYYPPSPVVNHTVYFTGFVNSYYGTISSTFWDFGDGHYAYGINVAHVYTKPGNYTVLFQIVNSSGDVAYVTRVIRIRSSDILPVAKFTVCGNSSPITAGSSIHLISKSYDPDGEILSSKWDINGQTFEGNTVNITVNSTGVYKVSLSVTDNSGLSSNQTQYFIVFPRINVSYFSDSDSDGWSNLAELIAGTDIYSSNSKPASFVVRRSVSVNNTTVCVTIYSNSTNLTEIVEYLPPGTTFLNCSARDYYCYGDRLVVLSNLSRFSYLLKVNNTSTYYLAGMAVDKYGTVFVVGGTQSFCSQSLTKPQIFQKIMEDITLYSRAPPSEKVRIFQEIMELIQQYVNAPP